MAEKQKQTSEAKDVKEAKKEPCKKISEPSPHVPISYVYLVAVSVVVVMVAAVFNCEGTLRLLGLQWIPVDPKPIIDKANIIQPDIGNLDHKLDTIPDSKVEPKVEPKQTDIKEVVEEEAKTKPETDQKDKEPKKRKKPKKKQYAKHNITNEIDYEIRAQLDEGDSLLKEGNYRAALSVFNDILLDYPESPRALWGKGCATDDRAAAQRSNTLIDEAIEILKKVCYDPSTPKALVIEAGRRLAERQTFRGSKQDASNTWEYMSSIFPLYFELQMEFGIRLLSRRDYGRARPHFQKFAIQGSSETVTGTDEEELDDDLSSAGSHAPYILGNGKGIGKMSSFSSAAASTSRVASSSSITKTDLNEVVMQMLSKADSMGHTPTFSGHRRIVHDFTCLLEGHMLAIPEDSWHDFEIDCLNLVQRFRQRGQATQQQQQHQQQHQQQRQTWQSRLQQAWQSSQQQHQHPQSWQFSQASQSSQASQQQIPAWPQWTGTIGWDQMGPTAPSSNTVLVPSPS